MRLLVRVENRLTSGTAFSAQLCSDADIYGKTGRTFSSRVAGERAPGLVLTPNDGTLFICSNGASSVPSPLLCAFASVAADDIAPLYLRTNRGVKKFQYCHSKQRPDSFANRIRPWRWQRTKQINEKNIFIFLVLYCCGFCCNRHRAMCKSRGRSDRRSRAASAGESAAQRRFRMQFGRCIVQRQTEI